MDRLFWLDGITQKGKNRVRENGNVWKETHITSPLRSDQFLIKSSKTGNMRWVRKVNDPDFIIKEWVI